MTRKEIIEACWNERELEYHVTGGETDPEHLLPGPGWYPCIINYAEKSGNVEISLASPELEGIDITVHQKNIPGAFRKKRERKEVE